MTLSDIILRVVSLTGFTTKGSILTWTEVDNNFIALGTAINNLETVKSTEGNASPPNGSIDNLSTGYKYPAMWLTTSNSLFLCTASTNSSATWILIFGGGL